MEKKITKKKKAILGFNLMNNKVYNHLECKQNESVSIDITNLNRNTIRTNDIEESAISSKFNDIEFQKSLSSYDLKSILRNNTSIHNEDKKAITNKDSMNPIKRNSEIETKNNKMTLSIINPISVQNKMSCKGPEIKNNFNMKKRSTHFISLNKNFKSNTNLKVQENSQFKLSSGKSLHNVNIGDIGNDVEFKDQIEEIKTNKDSILKTNKKNKTFNKSLNLSLSKSNSQSISKKTKMNKINLSIDKLHKCHSSKPKLKEKEKLKLNKDTINIEIKEIQKLTPEITYLLQKPFKKNAEINKIVNYLLSFKEFIEFLRTSHDKFDELLLNVAAKMKYENYSSNQMLFRIGDTGDKFYLILKGSVSIFIMNDYYINIGFEDYFFFIIKLFLLGEFHLVRKNIETKSFVDVEYKDLINYLNKFSSLSNEEIVNEYIDLNSNNPKNKIIRKKGITGNLINAVKENKEAEKNKITGDPKLKNNDAKNELLSNRYKIVGDRKVSVLVRDNTIFQGFNKIYASKYATNSLYISPSKALEYKKTELEKEEDLDYNNKSKTHRIGVSETFNETKIEVSELSINKNNRESSACLNKRVSSTRNIDDKYKLNNENIHNLPTRKRKPSGITDFNSKNRSFINSDYFNSDQIQGDNNHEPHNKISNNVEEINNNKGILKKKGLEENSLLRSQKSNNNLITQSSKFGDNNNYKNNNMKNKKMSEYKPNSLVVNNVLGIPLNTKITNEANLFEYYKLKNHKTNFNENEEYFSLGKADIHKLEVGEHPQTNIVNKSVLNTQVSISKNINLNESSQLSSSEKQNNLNLFKSKLSSKISHSLLGGFFKKKYNAKGENTLNINNDRSSIFNKKPFLNKDTLSNINNHNASNTKSFFSLDTIVNKNHNILDADKEFLKKLAICFIKVRDFLDQELEKYNISENIISSSNQTDNPNIKKSLVFKSNFMRSILNTDINNNPNLNSLNNQEAPLYNFKLTAQQYVNFLLPKLVTPIKTREVNIFTVKNFRVMDQGDKFGEKALVSKVKERTASVYMNEETHFGILEGKSFKQYILLIDEKIRNIYIENLVKNQLFMNTKINIKYLFEKLKVTKLIKGERKYNQGEMSNHIIFVIKGEFEITCSKSAMELVSFIRNLTNDDDFFKQEINNIETMTKVMNNLKNISSYTNKSIKKFKTNTNKETLFLPSSTNLTSQINDNKEIKLVNPNSNSVQNFFNAEFNIKNDILNNLYSKINSINTRKTINLGRVKQNSIIGFDDILDPETGVALFSLTCVSKEAEIFCFDRKKLLEYCADENNLATNYRVLMNKKIKILKEKSVRYLNTIFKRIYNSEIYSSLKKKTNKENFSFTKLVDILNMHDSAKLYKRIKFKQIQVELLKLYDKKRETRDIYGKILRKSVIGKFVSSRQKLENEISKFNISQENLLLNLAKEVTGKDELIYKNSFFDNNLNDILIRNNKRAKSVNISNDKSNDVEVNDVTYNNLIENCYFSNEENNKNKCSIHDIFKNDINNRIRKFSVQIKAENMKQHYGYDDLKISIANNKVINCNNRRNSKYSLFNKSKQRNTSSGNKKEFLQNKIINKNKNKNKSFGITLHQSNIDSIDSFIIKEEMIKNLDTNKVNYITINDDYKESDKFSIENKKKQYTERLKLHKLLNSKIGSSYSSLTNFSLSNFNKEYKKIGNYKKTIFNDDDTYKSNDNIFNKKEDKGDISSEKQINYNIASISNSLKQKKYDKANSFIFFKRNTNTSYCSDHKCNSYSNIKSKINIANYSIESNCDKCDIECTNNNYYHKHNAHVNNSLNDSKQLITSSISNFSPLNTDTSWFKSKDIYNKYYLNNNRNDKNTRLSTNTNSKSKLTILTNKLSEASLNNTNNRTDKPISAFGYKKSLKIKNAFNTDSSNHYHNHKTNMSSLTNTHITISKTNISERKFKENARTNKKNVSISKFRSDSNDNNVFNNKEINLLAMDSFNRHFQTTNYFDLFNKNKEVIKNNIIFNNKNDNIRSEKNGYTLFNKNLHKSIKSGIH